MRTQSTPPIPLIMLYIFLVCPIANLWMACTAGNGTTPNTIKGMVDFQRIPESITDTAMAYGLDPKNGTLVLLDLDSDTFTDEFPTVEGTQPLFIGGVPQNLAILDGGSLGYDALLLIHTVIGNQNTVVYVGANYKDTITHTLLALDTTSSSTRQPVASFPKFTDTRNPSTPRISTITITDDAIPDALWSLRYQGNQTYTLSYHPHGVTTETIIADNILENTTFTGGGISFLITPGGRKVDGDDRFTFYTRSLNGLSFSDGDILDIAASDTGLFILYRAPDSKMQLNTYPIPTTPSALSTSLASPVSTVDIQGLSSGPMSLSGQHLLIGDTSGTTANGQTTYTLTAIDISDPTIDGGDYRTLSLDIPIFKAILDDENGLFYVLNPRDDMMHIIQEGATPKDAAILRSIDLGDTPSAITLVDGIDGTVIPNLTTPDLSRSVIFVALLRGNLALFDTSQILDKTVNPRIDASGTSRGAQTTVPQFIDTGEVSEVQITSLTADDTEALTENWLLTYEGTVPNSVSTSGTLSGLRLTDPQATFTTLNITPKYTDDAMTTENTVYDQVDIDGIGTFDIAHIVSDTEIQLEATNVVDTTDGTDLSYTIRADHSFTVIGSRSGFQKSRATFNETYISDTGAVSFVLQNSFFNPVSRGDLLTFDTTTGIDTIAIGRNTDQMVYIATPNSTDPTYALYTVGTGSFFVSKIDLERLTVIKQLQ